MALARAFTLAKLGRTAEAKEELATILEKKCFPRNPCGPDRTFGEGHMMQPLSGLRDFGKWLTQGSDGKRRTVAALGWYVKPRWGNEPEPAAAAGAQPHWEKGDQDIHCLCAPAHSGSARRMVFIECF